MERIRYKTEKFSKRNICLDLIGKNYEVYYEYEKENKMIHIATHNNYMEAHDDYLQLIILEKDYEN